MVTDSASSRETPSVDPEIEQAATDVMRDPDADFLRQRELREQEAKEYVERELRFISMRRRSRVRASLAELSDD